MIHDLILSASESRRWWLAGGLHPSQVIAAYQPKGAASLEASYVNLANPGTYDAQVGVAPTLDSSGSRWVFNGASYLIGPVVSSAGFAVRFSDYLGALYRNVVGVVDGSNDLSFMPNGGTNHQYRNSASGIVRTYLPEIYSGTIVINGVTGALNGAIERSDLGGTYAGSLNIYIGAKNNNGVVIAPITCKILAVCFFAPGTTLTAAQIAALSAAMAAL